MDTKYTNPIKTGTFDENGQPFTLINPLPTEVTNFPSDYAIPAAQLSLLNQEATQELIRLLLVSLDGKFNSLGQKISDDSHPVVLSTEQEVILNAIKVAVENLDLDIEDIATEATLLAFKNAFDARDLATETTLADLNTKLNTFGQKASAASTPVVLSTEQEAILQAIQNATENASTNLATEATLELVRLLLVSLDAKDFATETTLADLNTKLNTLGQKTSAASAPVVLSTEQETILSAIQTAVQASSSGGATEVTLDALLTAFNLEDFATETTLADLNTKLNTLGQKASAASAPVVLSTEQEAILEAMKVALQNLDVDLDGIATEVTLNSLLTAFNLEDFATETTLANLNTKLNTLGQKTSAASAPVVLSSEQETILSAIQTAVQTSSSSGATEVTLDALLTAFNAEDFATETTLADLNTKLNTLGQKASTASAPVVLSTEQEAILSAIETAIGGLDTSNAGLATEATLDALRIAFNAEDFATETTLASIDGKLNSLGQKTMSGSVPVVLSSDHTTIKVSSELAGGAAFKTLSVGISAVELKVGASILTGRRFVHIQPKAQGLFWGYDNTVSAANGTELFKNQIIVLPSSENTPLWLISSIGTIDVRIGELG